MRTRRGAGRGVGLRPRGRDWIWAGAAAGLVLSALRARSRAEALSTLEGWVPGGDAADVPVGLGRFRLVAVEGSEIDEATVAAAVAHAETHGLDVLELLPGDLDAEQVLEVLRSVDPSSYRDDRFALGRGANQAVLLSDPVVARIGDLPAEPVPAEPEPVVPTAPEPEPEPVGPSALERHKLAERSARGEIIVGGVLTVLGLGGVGAMTAGLLQEGGAEDDGRNTMIAAGAVSGAIGLALGVALLVDGVRDLKAARPGRSARVRVAPTFGGLVVSGRF